MSVVTDLDNSVDSSSPKTFPMPWILGAANQGIRSATRKLCALVAAQATNIHDYRDVIGDCGVPESRAQFWADSINLVDYERSRVHDVDGRILDPYQVQAIHDLPQAGGVLAFGCGLGKTLTALGFAYARGRTSRLWIICPRNAFGAWKRHQEWIDERFDEVRILSMDSAHKHVLEASADPFLGGTVIFDETHKLGVASARRTKKAHEIRKYFDVGIPLTGTLLHAGVEKVLSILDLAIPGAALFTSPFSAGRHFKCLTLDHNPNTGRQNHVLRKPSGEHKDAFFTYLSRYTVSLLSRSESVRQSVDLPPQTIETVFFGQPWRNLHEAVAFAALEIETETGELPHLSAVLHHLAKAELEAKLDWLFDELDDEPVVIFANYLDTLRAVEARLSEQGLSYVLVDGTVSGDDRIAAQEQFQRGDVNIFLGQITAASVSMDLFRAAVSVTIDHSWRSDDYDQSLARTCRRGQQRPCLHIDLVGNLLQQRIVDRVREGQSFNSELAEWQELRTALNS